MDRVINEFRWCMSNYLLFLHRRSDDMAEHFKGRMYQTKLCLNLAGVEVDFYYELAIQQLRHANLLDLISD